LRGELVELGGGDKMAVVDALHERAGTGNVRVLNGASELNASMSSTSTFSIFLRDLLYRHELCPRSQRRTTHLKPTRLRACAPRQPSTPEIRPLQRTR
jgi:hypothetical protein